MPDYSLPSVSLNQSGGLESILSYVVTQEPSFMVAILFLLFISILSAGWGFQTRTHSRGSFSMWMSIASIITTTGGFILFLIVGLINLKIMVIMVIITLCSVFWFIYSTRE